MLEVSENGMRRCAAGMIAAQEFTLSTLVPAVPPFA